ncbi:MAG TPA: LamG domain-containing protein [Verrucomicrobiae bacterium]|nr:LamG domain-containing protein [Verrucomicrobiae bacterium]
MAATLTHRYSFNADASDSVGGADGVLLGNAYVTNGALVLDGTNSSVQLPNDLFTNYDSISFEMWFANGALTSPTAQLYTFSGTNGIMTYALDGQGNYTSNYYVGGVVLLRTDSVALPIPAVANVVHLVWTQDSASQTASLYVNGLLAGQNTNFTFTPALIGSTTNDYIGGIGSTSTAANFQGNILEFRAYQGAMSPLDVAVADALGPDQTRLDPGALQDLRLVAPPPTGPGALFRAGVNADFANVTNVNISTQPDLILSSDNTNVIVIAPDQRLQTVGQGVADVTASYRGFSNTLAVTVGVPQDVALIHRYSFNEQTNDWIIHDSAGDADGQIIGNTYQPYAFQGTNGVYGTNQLLTTRSDYGELPPGLISCLSEVSIEAWVTWLYSGNGIPSTWQRIFDFGNYGSVGNVGSTNNGTYFFLTPEAASGTGYAYPARTTISENGKLGETPILNWTNSLPLSVPVFVGVTYSPVHGVMKFYINGRPVASGIATIPLSAIVDINDWLGKSQYSDDPPFIGLYDEFRIYRGLLSDTDVAADYAAGPNAVGVDYVLHDFPSSNSLNITWGTTATNWFLESSPTLGPGATWAPVPATPMLQNGRYNVAVPISGDTGYFRLHAPP